MPNTGFSVNYNKASNRYNAPEGEYETVIEQAAWAKTFAGKEYILLKLVVRSDVKQAEQGETIEYQLWRSKPENIKPSDIAGVPAWRIHQVSKAAGLTDGEVVSSVEEWFNILEGKTIRVTVKQDDEGRAKVTRVEESQYALAKGAVRVDKDALPF